MMRKWTDNKSTQSLGFAEHHESRLHVAQGAQAHRRCGPAKAVVVSINRLVEASTLRIEVAAEGFAQDSAASFEADSVRVNVSESIRVVVNK